MAEDRSAISGVGHHGPTTSETVAGMADLGRWRDSSACAVWGGYSFSHGAVVRPNGRLCPANGPLNPVVASFDLVKDRVQSSIPRWYVFFYSTWGASGEWILLHAASLPVGTLLEQTNAMHWRTALAWPNIPLPFGCWARCGNGSLKASAKPTRNPATPGKIGRAHV